MAHAVRLNVRMQKELRLLMSDPPYGVSLLPVSGDDSSSSFSLTTIEARIQGPEGTVYSEGVFRIRIQVPERRHAQSKEYKYNRLQFDQNARIWTKKHAKAEVGADKNEVGILANPNTIEVEASEAKPEDNDHESGRGSQKTSCPAGEKLQIKPVAHEDRLETDHKKNVQSSNRLSLSRSLNPLSSAAAKAVPCSHADLDVGRTLSVQDHNRLPACEDVLSLGQDRKLTEEVVVSDSEEKEEEDHRPTKFRPSLRRERIVGKWKSA